MSLATRTSATTTSCAPTRWGTSGGLWGRRRVAGGPLCPCALGWAAAGPQGGRGIPSTHTRSGLCSAFNNILSNLGYVLLGLLFLLIILQREINYNRALLRNDSHALVRDRAAWGGSAAWWGSASRTPRFSFLPLLCLAGVWHPQALRALLRHGHRPYDGGAAQRLLPRLPQLHQLPVW